jgi:lactoylglutathione lyase
MRERIQERALLRRNRQPAQVFSRKTAVDNPIIRMIRLTKADVRPGLPHTARFPRAIYVEPTMPNFIKHIAFKVEDVEKGRAFYENVFGYRHVNTVLRKGKNGDHVSHHLTDGYMDLTLIHYESSSADQADFAGPAPCIHHIGMEAEDLDAFIEQIKANGGEILTAPGH